MGIVNGEDYQIVYSDTPGILKPSYKLHETMLKSVKTALTDADVMLYITDINENFEKNEDVMNNLRKTSVPVLLLINKIDIAAPGQVEKMIPEWQAILPQAEIFAISALQAFNLDGLLRRIQELLPESPAYYPKDDLSDRTERFFVSEIIREKIFFNYREEIPYSCEVVVETFEEENAIIRIGAVIYVARDSQKGIIIGNKGAALKKTGTQARLDIERFLGKKVFLQLLVKESKDWRNIDKKLKEFGYQ